MVLVPYLPNPHEHPLGQLGRLVLLQPEVDQQREHPALVRLKELPERSYLIHRDNVRPVYASPVWSCSCSCSRSGGCARRIVQYMSSGSQPSTSICTVAWVIPNRC